MSFIYFITSSTEVNEGEARFFNGTFPGVLMNEGSGGAIEADGTSTEERCAVELICPVVMTLD
jgi:hypothetical protein